jgi:hemolysin III
VTSHQSLDRGATTNGADAHVPGFTLLGSAPPGPRSRTRPQRVSAREVPETPPRLRGWLHAGAAPLVLVAGVVLVLLAPDERTRAGSAIYALTALAGFAASTAMHLGLWHPSVAVVVRRLDHACVFVSIAGSYTPFTLLMLTGEHRAVMLAVVWAGAALGVSLRLLWTAAPRWLYTVIALVLGWAGALFAADFVGFEPVAVPVLMILGLVLYSVGGLVYAVRRPDPWPSSFGFHEVFHALTIAGFATQYVGILIATCRLR